MKKFIKRRISKLVASSTALTLALSSVPFNVFASNTADTVITIYHTNDMHGNVKDLANVKTLKDATKNSILVDAGDCTQGSALATYTKGEAIIEIMNATSYDAIALGNHEFDFGSQKAIDNMKKAKFSPLAANVVNNKGEVILNGINNGNGANVIKEIDGKKIGIFGLTTEETSYKTNPKNLNGVEFKSVIETAKKQVEILKKQNVDVIVAVTHLGNDASSNPTSIDLAKEVPELDLIIDGHSHTIIQEKVGNVTVVQTGTGLKNLGKVTLNFKGNDLSIGYELLNMEDVVKENKANETVSSVYNKYDNTVSETLKEVIGKTTTELYAYAEDGTRVVRIEETPMGDLIADAMVFGAKKLLETTEYKDLPIVALENGGGVRASISAGDITLEDVFNVLPFGNIISVKVITPDKLYNALENGVCKMTIDANGTISGLDGRFPQISGMRIEIDVTKTPFNPEKPEDGTGERVVAIYLVDENGNETLLNRKDTKTEIAFASNDFIIAGGDGYTTLGNLKHIAEGEVLDSILSEYIKILTEQGNGSFEYKMPGNRTKVINTSTEYKTLNIDKFAYLQENVEVDYYLDVPKTPTHWAEDAIYYLKALNVFGNEENFYPNKTVTYAEFAQMLQKLLGLESNNLEEYGILYGMDKPTENKVLTREELAYMLANIIKLYGIETKDFSNAKDIKEPISEYALNNINFAIQKGILKGDDKGNFNFQKEVKKAELAVMLNNLVYLYFED